MAVAEDGAFENHLDLLVPEPGLLEMARKGNDLASKWECKLLRTLSLKDQLLSVNAGS